MSEIGAYEDKLKGFDWSIAEKDLGYEKGDRLNIGEMCTDRICRLGLGSKLALIWEDIHGHEKRYSFDDLRTLSNTIAKFYVDIGVKPGERVCLFMDRVPELYLGFLGLLKMGAIVQPLFSAFREDSLHTRLENAATVVVMTQKKLLPVVRKARERLPNLRNVVVVDADGAALKPGELAFDLEKATRIESFDAYPSTGETPSVLHYTSGTTGQPKGAQHVHYSIISQYLTTRWVLDVGPDDIYWCNADPGWVTGTSYGIIGPWVNGVTQAVLDSGFNTERWYSFIAKHRITVWYSAPTAIRLLMRDGTEVARRFDLSSLRHLCSVGEPLNPEAVIWSKEAFGKAFHDTYWQTETGCIVVSNYPGMPIKPGSMGKPFPGITATIVDPEKFEPITKPGSVGLIALRPGWPSMIRSYWNNQTGYEAKFKNGWYLTFDRASIDNDGYYWFVGRDDDVINTGGHLVGPFEIESALLEHQAVAKSAAVAKP
ncbi:MAG: AMP-binding protein, partial [Pseudomonadota bacterium]